MSDFWEHVLIRGDLECWEWERSRYRFGYGQARHEGRQQPAHRVAWMLCRGPIPEGLNVLHSCDNPPCVNPSHLFLGTQADNVRDMVRKGRVSHAPRVHAPKLSPEQAVEVRIRYAAGNVAQASLAAAFGVSQQTISRTVNA